MRLKNYCISLILALAVVALACDKPKDGTDPGTQPKGGEIDIMDYVGSIPFHNLGSVHYAWSWKNNQYQSWNHEHKGSYYSFVDKQMPAVKPSYGICNCSGSYISMYNFYRLGKSV
jgi:hypothetical protein